MKQLLYLAFIVSVLLIWAWFLMNIQNILGSSEWGKDLKKCTDIWQSTHNETLYYDCMNPLDREAYGAEIPDYIKEIKFQTCHVTMDIYNLSSYYRCIGI